VHCKFRHFDAAKSGENCDAWARGQCQDMACAKKHIHSLGNIPCRFEFAPGGCTNASCNFKHTLPRNNGELQQKLTALLAEHENGKENDSADPAPAKCSDEEEELDLDALRAQALKSVEAKQSSKVKATKRKSGPDDAELEVKKAKNGPLQNVRLRLGPRPPGGIQRRIINKSEYSEDEVSDLSLDELTDEEQEDLRATLNKNKVVKRVHNVTVTKPTKSEDSQRLIRKINVKTTKKSPVKKEQSRLITLRKISNDEDNSSRPSSSEWIERKISVKKPESEYSDAEVEMPVKPKKRKPNLAWVGLSQNDSTEELDLAKRKRSSEPEPEFNRRITVQNDRCKSIQSRLGAKTTTTGIKARLGGAKTNVKSRLGGLDTRLGKKTITNEIAERPKIVSLKRANPVEEPKAKSVEKAEQPEKIETEQRAEKPVATKKARTPPREAKPRVNSTQDLEADLLNSGSDLDDLEIGDDIDDDELFS